MDSVSLLSALIGGVSAAIVNGVMNLVSAGKTEKLRAALGQATYEYQTRLSGLHVRRLEAIGSVYASLWLTEMSFDYATPKIRGEGEPGDTERFEAYLKDARDLIRCFAAARVFLDEDLCRSVEEFIIELQRGWWNHRLWLSEDGTGLSKAELHEQVQGTKKSLETMRVRIEQEMRKDVDAGEARAGVLSGRPRY